MNARSGALLCGGEYGSVKVHGTAQGLNLNGWLHCTWYNQVALDKSRPTGSAGSRLRGEHIGSTMPAIVCFVKSNIKSGNFSTQKCEKCVAAYFGRTMNVRQNTANRLKSIYNMTKF